MPYTFITIERHKSWLIRWLSLVLVFFYFLSFFWVWFLARAILPFFFYKEGFPAVASISFSSEEVCAVFLSALLAGLIHWSNAQYRLIDRMLGAIGAEPLRPDDAYHQMFKNTLEEISLVCPGVIFEPCVIPSPALNAFSLEDGRGRRVVGVTEGLLGQVTRSQLQAIVGHEIAHILSGDCQAATLTSALFEMHAAILDKESSEMFEEFAEARVFMPVVVTIIYLIESIGELLHVCISRQREFRADAIAVKMTRDPLTLAQVLDLISRSRASKQMKPGKLSSIFIVNPLYRKLDEQEGIWADLFSTHPPLKKRIAVLLAMAGADDSALARGHDAQESTPQHIGALASGVPGIDLAAGLPAVSVMDCAHSLQDETYEGSRIKRCHLCRGVFLKRGDLLRIVLRKSRQFSPTIVQKADALLGQRNAGSAQVPLSKDIVMPCPECHKKMDKMYLSWVLDLGFREDEQWVQKLEPLPVAIDKCKWCDAIWLSREDLELVQCIYEKYR